ncbi:MAG: hypothetical protein ACE37F_36890 [Nannocystaceae bacterium]|nr:hypothetical protein [bacterium]
MPDPQDVPFDFDHVVVETEGFSCGVLVMTPQERTVLGEAQREHLRSVPPLSEVEQAILDRIAERPKETPILIIRGADDEGRSLWSFDASWNDEELEETGLVFSRAVMPFYRGLLDRGIVLFVHSDWGFREIGPIRRGLNALADQVSTSSTDGAVAAIDEWIVRNMLLYSSLSLTHVVERLLPTHLRLLERRGDRVRRLFDRVGG